MKNKPQILIRPARLDDGSQIGQLIYDTVHCINRRDYSDEQVNVWAPDPYIYSTYDESYAFVAEIGKQLAGFANITSDGYLHRFYVHKDFQRQGVGRRLLEAVERKAKGLKLQRIHTEASITAKPFFIANGYIVIEKQVKTLRGMNFINYKMEKQVH